MCVCSQESSYSLCGGLRVAVVFVPVNLPLYACKAYRCRVLGGTCISVWRLSRGAGGDGGSVWLGRGGGRRWQRRIRARSTLFSVLCGGGWRVLLRK